MVDLNKSNFLKIVGVLMLITLIGINTYGIPVPMESPFVRLEIVSEKNWYNVGESLMQQYLIRNQMPFPIQLTFTKNMTYNPVILENTTQVARGWVRTEGDQIRINPLSTYELMLAGPNPVEPCTILFELNVEDLHVTRTVQVLPQGVGISAFQ